LVCLVIGMCEKYFMFVFPPSSVKPFPPNSAGTNGSAQGGVLYFFMI